jgi:hypothetical protein
MIKWVTSFFHLLLPIKLIRRIAQYNSTRYSVIGDKNGKALFSSPLVSKWRQNGFVQGFLNDVFWC